MIDWNLKIFQVLIRVMERDWSLVRGRKIMADKVKPCDWTLIELSVLKNIQKTVEREICRLQLDTSKETRVTHNESHKTTVTWITS